MTDSLRYVQGGSPGPVPAFESQPQKNSSEDSVAGNVMGAGRGPLQSPNARIMSPSLQPYGPSNLAKAGDRMDQPGALRESPMGMHGVPVARELRSEPSRARDAIGRFEQAASFKSAVTDQDANPPDLASPTEAALNRPVPAGSGPGRLVSSFVPSAGTAVSPGRPLPQAISRAASPVKTHKNAARMGQACGDPMDSWQSASAGSAAAGPLGASLHPPGPAGLQPGRGRPPDPQVSPRNLRRPVWEQLLGSVGTLMRPNASPPRARSPAHHPASTAPSEGSAVGQGLQMREQQQQQQIVGPSSTGISSHPPASRALQHQTHQQQQVMQQYSQTTRMENSMAYPPASRAGFVHTDSWGMSSFRNLQGAAAAGILPQAVPFSQHVIAPQRPVDLSTKVPPVIRSFQSPMRPPARMQPIIPSVVRSASRASQRGSAPNTSCRDSLQEQVGPLGAARMSSLPPGINPVLRPSSSVAGAVAAQGFNQLQVKS